MLPPATVVTIKKRAASIGLIVLVSFFTSCTQPGPRALLKGERLLREGQPERALKELQTAVRLLPKSAPSWNLLGLAHHGAGQAPEAFRAYRQALTLDHKLAAARYNLGCLFLEQNNPAAAIEELTSFTLLQGNSLDGWLKLGTAQLRARRYDAAEKSFKTALELHPRQPEALNALGIVQLQRRLPQDAYNHFNVALVQNTNYAPALLNSAIAAHVYLNNRSLALRKYKQYLELRPRPTNAAEVEVVAQSLEADLAGAPGRRGSTNLTTSSALPGSRDFPPFATEAQRSPPAPGPQVSAGSQDKTRAAQPAAVDPGKNAAAPPSPSANKPGTVEPKTSAPAANNQTGVALAKNEPQSSKRNVPQRATPPPIKPAVTAAAEPSAAKAEPPKAESSTTVAVERSSRPIAPTPPPRRIPRYQYLPPGPPLAGTFETFYTEGLSAYRAGRFQDALVAYEHALALKPDSVNARYNFALALSGSKYPIDAANELTRLLKSNPKDVGAHLMLANLYAQELDQPGRAREHYQKVLEGNPGHSQAPRIRVWLNENP